MKKFFSNPGFEFIFSFGLMAILGLPPVLMAQAQKQAQKDVEIRIENGDTIINGRNIKQLSEAQRRDALNDIRHINVNGNTSTHLQFSYSYPSKDNDSLAGRIKHIEIRRRKGGVPPMVTDIVVNGNDSLGGGRARFREMNMAGMGFGRPGMNGLERKNTQNFNYVSTDKDGISTRVAFHISEVSNDDLKRMPHVEGGKFEIENLNVVPEFTTGKTLLMFNLPLKTIAEVRLHDSEGRLLWSDKAVNGNFSKIFTLGLNGIYYLQIKQGNNIALKRIVKTE